MDLLPVCLGRVERSRRKCGSQHTDRSIPDISLQSNKIRFFTQKEMIKEKNYLLRPRDLDTRRQYLSFFTTHNSTPKNKSKTIQKWSKMSKKQSIIQLFKSWKDSNCIAQLREKNAFFVLEPFSRTA